MTKKIIKFTGILSVIFVLVANLQYAVFNYGLSENSLSLPTYAQTSTNAAGSSSSDYETEDPNMFWDEVTSPCVYVQTIPMTVTTYSNYSNGGNVSVGMVGDVPTSLTLGNTNSGANYVTVTTMAAILFTNSGQATNCEYNPFHLCDFKSCAASNDSPKKLLYGELTHDL